MNYKESKDYIDSNRIDSIISKIVYSNDLINEKTRYHKILDEAKRIFGDGDFHFISSPGRSEIGGNHTDHQHGRVVCASLSIDNLVVCKTNDTNIITYIDSNFGEIVVDISDLSIHEKEVNTSSGLIRGIAARLKEMGYKIGGFDAVCDSKVLIGAAISSSACFEMMIVEIFSALFNDDKVGVVERALIGQYAENKYFGKPSGLLDQLAISQGGFAAIDFKDPANPIIKSYDFNFDDYGYKFLIVNTKGDHSNLSYEYAAITSEIREVANELGVDYLRDSSYEKLINNIETIRNNVKNDRAILRSIHFFEEDLRAEKERAAIENKDINLLLKLMKESGKSSFEYLQNVYQATNTKSQSIALGLAVTEKFLEGEGAYRIQGGGFEGTILVIVPNKKVEEYSKLITSIFGKDAILESSIRPFGVKLVF